MNFVDNDRGFVLDGIVITPQRGQFPIDPGAAVIRQCCIGVPFPEHGALWNTVFHLWDHVDSFSVPYSCGLDGDPGGNDMLIQETPIAHMRVGLRTDYALIEKARHIHNQRRLREEILGNELFGDPGWDLMLDLYIAQASGKRVSVTSAAIGSGKPMSTGLRWVKLLIERGLIIREADPYDGRRSYLRLTPSAYEAMEDFLERC